MFESYGDIVNFLVLNLTIFPFEDFLAVNVVICATRVMMRSLGILNQQITVKLG